MGALVSDFRSALRSLAGRPAFTAVAVLTLALGIGANTAIFSVVHAVLLRPLPYRDADRLLRISAEIPDFHMEIVGGADYLDWRDNTHLLSSIAAWDDSARFSLRQGEQPERLEGARVSASFLSTLGVQPAQGRGILPDEKKLNGGRPVVVTQRLWDRLFGAGTPLHEQALRLDDGVWTVVGVLPRDFLFPRNADVDLLVPLALDEAVERSRQRMSLLDVIGRLRRGATLAQARAELKTIQDRAINAAQDAVDSGRSAEPGAGGPGGSGGLPAPPRGGGGMQITMRSGGGPPGSGPAPRLPRPLLQVVPLRDWLVGDVRPALVLMLGAVGLVLLIACANVANLLLARATARRQEIAIRAALGAGRGQIVRLLLAESAVLGLLGGACGILLALLAIKPLIALMPADLAAGLFRQTRIGLDGAVLAFTLLLSAGSALLFGLAPALTAARPNLHNPLKEGARGGSGAVRSVLVAAEVALAVVLLVCAGLLLHSFSRLLAVDPGFDPAGVLTMRVELDPQRALGPDAQTAFFQGAAERLRALPGVESASWGDSLPLTGFTMMVRGLEAEGKPRLDPERQPEVVMTSVGPDYFHTLGIRILRGRELTRGDDSGAPVAVISQGLARKFWGDDDPVGRRFRRGRQPEWTTVVGVAADVKHEGLDEATPRVQMYQPFSKMPLPFSFVAVRTSSAPAGLAKAVRQEILALDRTASVFNVATMQQRLADTVADRRFNLALVGLFALLALVLAAVGLYGVLAYAVTERTHEIGIRLALGAERHRVLRLILRQGLTLTAAGIAFGLPASLLLGRALRSSLFGVSIVDPATFVLIPLVLLASALLAAWLPARRATRVDPMVALREE